MFRLFKKKGVHKMFDKDKLKELSKEEKLELLEYLKSEITEETETKEETVEEENEETKEQEEQTGNQDEDNELVGGKADNMTLEDIAKKHNVTVEQLQAELEKGMKVEAEHTDDPEKQKEIAMDHLVEKADYYEKLEIVEGKTNDESKTDNVVDEKETILDAKEELPSFEEQVKALESRIDEKISPLLAKVDELSKINSGLEKEIKELKRTQPMSAYNPKPNDDKATLDGEKRDKFIESYKKQYQKK